MGKSRKGTGTLKAWKVRVTRTAKGLIKNAPREIQRALKEKLPDLRENPELGKPLTGPLLGRRRLPLSGRWRLIYRIVDSKRTVYLEAVGIRKAGDRKDIYELAKKLFRQGLL